VIEVTDNGIGIPPEEQGRLFRMFMQLPHSAARAQGGLGIGLALVKTLVDLHGGEVRVASRGLDEGSTFTVSLPLDRPGAAGPAPDAERPPAIAAAPLPPVRVLVIEDNEDGLASLVALLELLGATVTGAPDGRAGLDAARRFRPEVVLLDLGLPGIDGYEVARRLKSDPYVPGLRLVALTGWGADADRRRTAEAGFDLHLTKPLDMPTLVGAFRQLGVRATQASGD
jgi:CheY-like chemotaxis protein